MKCPSQGFGNLKNREIFSVDLQESTKYHATRNKKKGIKMLVDKNSMIAEMPEEMYHSDPTPILDGFAQSASLSSSMASDILTTTEERAMLGNRRLNPLAKNKKSDSMDDGTIYHDFVLRGRIGFEIAPFKDFKSNAAKEYKETAEARGVIVLSQSKGNDILNTSKAMKLRLLEEMSNAPDFTGLFQSGTPEVSAFSFDGEIWNRARFDWLDNKFPDVIFDYKTTGLEFQNWERGLWNDERFVQATHYKKVYREVTGRDARFVYVIQQDFEPYDFIIMEIGRDYEDEIVGRYDLARRRFVNCLRTGKWRGEYKGVRHAYPPTYVMQKWEVQNVEEKAVDSDNWTNNNIPQEIAG